MVTVTKLLTVTVKSQTGTPYPNLKVYAFDPSTGSGQAARYTGFNGTTDTNGQVTLTLPQGSYHFRADYDGVQFWSNAQNTCTLPGCENSAVLLPGKKGVETVTIDYTYDPLYRLTAADYSSGDFYHYAYDSVGNRLTETTQLATKNYLYDEANRLASVDGVNYTWDANGNLLNDSVNEYVYDSANRLISVNGTSSYSYNGLGDRLSQTVDGAVINYTLDLNAGLTQVLSDDTNAYTYGLGRISQTNTSTEYFLNDALGSVRQLTASNGDVTLAKSYDPYGVVTSTNGVSQSNFGYTGESQGVASGMVYLRSRFYNPLDGRFQSRDTWGGDANRPGTLNRWNYGESNPIMKSDPSGMCWFYGMPFSNPNYDITHPPIEGPCQWFVNQAKKYGIQLSSTSTPADFEKASNSFIDFSLMTNGVGVDAPIPVSPLTSPENIWQLIEFRLDYRWTQYNTVVMDANYEWPVPFITPIGPITAGVGLSCDVYSGICDFSSHASEGVKWLNIGCALNVDSVLLQNKAYFGLYLKALEFEAILNPSKVTFSSPTTPTGLETLSPVDVGLKKVWGSDREGSGKSTDLVFTSLGRISQAGGYKAFAQRYLYSQTPPDLITYKIIRESIDREFMEYSISMFPGIKRFP